MSRYHPSRYRPHSQFWWFALPYWTNEDVDNICLKAVVDKDCEALCFKTAMKPQRDGKPAYSFIQGYVTYTQATNKPRDWFGNVLKRNDAKLQMAEATPWVHDQLDKEEGLIEGPMFSYIFRPGNRMVM